MCTVLMVSVIPTESSSSSSSYFTFILSSLPVLFALSSFYSLSSIRLFSFSWVYRSNGLFYFTLLFFASRFLNIIHFGRQVNLSFLHTYLLSLIPFCSSFSVSAIVVFFTCSIHSTALNTHIFYFHQMIARFLPQFSLSSYPSSLWIIPLSFTRVFPTCFLFFFSSFFPYYHFLPLFGSFPFPSHVSFLPFSIFFFIPYRHSLQPFHSFTHTRTCITCLW